MEPIKKLVTISIFLFLTLGPFSTATPNDLFGPFSPEADSYARTVQSTFENLPIIKDKKFIQANVPGTESIFRANLEHKFSEGVRKSLAVKYINIQMTRNADIRIYGPIAVNNKPVYLWTASGHASFYETYNTNTKQLGHYFFVSYFNENQWIECCLIFNNGVNTLNSSILNAASLVSEPIRLQKIKIMHDQAVAKSEWNFSRRTVKGKITGYKNSIVNIQDGNKRPFSLDVTKFSQDDQFLIRAYIDHKGISVRDSAGGK